MSGNAHRVVVLISGAVQGVFFRESAKIEARKLEISGSVENLPNGQVRIIAEGGKEKLEELIDWCKKGGPAFASVQDTQVEWQKAKGLFTNFEIH